MLVAKRVQDDSRGGRIFDERGQFRDHRGQLYHRVGTDVFSVSMDITSREESERPYEENVWIRAGVKAIANGFQRLKLRLYDRDPSDQDAVEVTDHPFLAVLAEPNLIQTTSQFWRSNATGFKIAGDEIWFLLDADGNPWCTPSNPEPAIPPAQILPVVGSMVQIDVDARGLPARYRYSTTSQGSSNTSAVFDAKSVVHFRDTDPYDWTRGLGDVEGLQREADLYFQEQRSIDAMLRNGGQPGGFLIYKHSVGPHEMERRQSEMDDVADIENGGGIKVVESDATFVPNPTKPSDMGHRSNMEWNRESILAGLGVPPPVVGIYDKATYNNVETAYREMWTGPNGILALANVFADVITERALPKFSRAGQKLYAAWDTSMIEALQDDVGGKIDRASEIAARGIGVSFNEILEMQGCEVESPEEGDRKWVQTGLHDLDDPEAGKMPQPEPAAAEEADEPDEEGAEPADEPEPESEAASTRATLTLSRTEGEVPYDRELAGRVEEWLADYERAQISRLQAIADGVTPSELTAWINPNEGLDPDQIPESVWDALLLSTKSWASKLEQEVRTALRAIYSEAFQEAHGEVPHGPFRSTADADVIEAMARQRIQVSEGVSSTLARQVRKSITRVLAGIDAPGPLRDVIRENLPELTGDVARAFKSKEARAATIAQTETAKARNTAKFTQYEASGAEGIKWSSSQDDAVRASHAAVNGQVVKPGERFSNGLRYPGDPLAPAAEVVGCRCAITPTTFRNPLDDVDIDEVTDEELDALLESVS